MEQPTFLYAYGLDTLLTDADDPELWEAALRRHWPPVNDPGCLVDALRFDIGRHLKEGEQPQGEKNEQDLKVRGMVDIEEWAFDRVEDERLRIKKVTEEVWNGSALYNGIGMMSIADGLLSFNAPPHLLIFMYLGISRPSRDLDQAVVYAATTAPGLGDGSAYIWQRQADGRWEQTDQKVAWWIS